jgi:hypothetical protein
LQTTAAAFSIAGLADWIGALPGVTADEAKLDPKLVRLQPDIEPLVRLLEETPREKVLEETANRIRKGTSYREVLAALLLAGVRNVQPRPNVGFKFHAVLVVNSAHIASLNSPDEHRWLPIFWAIDNFKSSQAQNQRESGWRMGPVAETKVPNPAKASAAFVDAMNAWDVEAADAAAAGIARSCGMNEAFELFARFGCRDFRDIGHKAIYVANAFRTLQCIGWQYAEPILRSLAYALQKYDGPNPAKSDAAADRPGRENLQRCKQIEGAWKSGKPDDGATRSVLSALRSTNAADMSKLCVDLLNKQVASQSIWDGLLLGSGELLMRQPGIVGLHTVTTTNALHYLYTASGDDETRRLLLLQNAAFLPLFLDSMKSRGKTEDVRIDEMQAPKAEGSKVTPEQIFADVGKDRTSAGIKTLSYLASGGDATTLIDQARLLIFTKGADSHDYKFSSAVLEDYHQVSPQWRDRFLAAGTYWLRGSSAKDNTLVSRVRQALRG